MSKDKKAQAASPVKSGIPFRTFENWAAQHDRTLFFVLLSLCIFLSLISFNARISEAHDDALYLEGGWRFVKEFPDYFYTQNAPLYPMFLALLIKLVGFRLILFKLVSLLLNTLGFVLFYKAFRGRLPYMIFLPVAFFQACNYLVLYFASMTFTEAFYFFLQGLFFFTSARLLDQLDKQEPDYKSQYGIWLLFGLSMFLISTAKSAAIVVIPAVLLFFALQRNWKAALYSILAYLAFKLPYELVVRSVWHAQNQFAGQSKILLQKDPYDRAQGTEDLSGFIQRFVDNCNLSLSKRFYQIIGWRDENSTEIYGLITLITIGLILFGFFRLYRKSNRLVVLASLFSGAQLTLSYIILQIRWDQPRITLVLMPVLLMLSLYAFYSFTSNKGIGPVIYLVVIVLLCGSVLLSSLKRGTKNIPIVKKNLQGDKYYGYTPDWQNFLKCSEWCADSLGQNTLVASRKAPMSFVYGKGKKFFPIYSVIKKDSATNQSDPDSALAYFKQNKVTHIMLGTLRLDPNNPGNGFINTVHNIAAPIAQKYPEKLKLVHVEGQFEEAAVYEIRY
ncbi:MAG TPA: hypothetical protein PLQ93_10330 [Bacteroidia bacterium]|nr:hypothetical protein [Bacteroidia bacterium]